MTHRATINVAGITIGLLEYEAQVDALLQKLIVVALISSLVGVVTYSTVRTLPLRALDRTLRDLADANRMIETKQRGAARSEQRADRTRTGAARRRGRAQATFRPIARRAAARQDRRLELPDRRRRGVVGAGVAAFARLRFAEISSPRATR